MGLSRRLGIVGPMRGLVLPEGLSALDPSRWGRGEPPGCVQPTSVRHPAPRAYARRSDAVAEPVRPGRERARRLRAGAASGRRRSRTSRLPAAAAPAAGWSERARGARRHARLRVSRTVRRRGCHGHAASSGGEVVEVDGLRVVGPADTWVDLGEVAGRGLTVDDLVVAGDVVVNRIARRARMPCRGASRGRVRPRGKALLVEVAAPGASRVEVADGDALTVDVRPGRLSRARAQRRTSATAHGGWLLEGDLVWRKQRVIGEYQGSDHASIRRRSADSSRVDRCGGRGLPGARDLRRGRLPRSARVGPA